MGSGKSVIGKELAKLYKIKFFDSDSEIEKIAKKSINKIFLDVSRFGTWHLVN